MLVLQFCQFLDVCVKSLPGKFYKYGSVSLPPPPYHSLFKCVDKVGRSPASPTAQGEHFQELLPPRRKGGVHSRLCFMHNALFEKPYRKPGHTAQWCFNTQVRGKGCMQSIIVCYCCDMPLRVSPREFAKGKHSVCVSKKFTITAT